MDVEKCANSVHSINLLTVIASEGYRNFVADLQTGIKEALYERPTKATVEYFTGKTVMVGEKTHMLSVQEAKDIYRYLIKNDYIDNNDSITEATGQTWKQLFGSAAESLAPLARVCMR